MGAVPRDEIHSHNARRSALLPPPHENPRSLLRSTARRCLDPARRRVLACHRRHGAGGDREAPRRHHLRRRNHLRADKPRCAAPTRGPPRRDRGENVVDVNYDENDIIISVETILKISKRTTSNVYGGGDAGGKIAKLLKELPLQFHKTITY